MNKRIKELAEEAWDSLIDEMGSFIDEGGRVNWDFLHAYDQRYAGLIVKEVFNAIENERYEIYEPVVKSVKEHFGVE